MTNDPASDLAQRRSVRQFPVESTMADLVRRAESLAVPGRRSILGLTGAPGAGKSTVASALLDALGDRAVLVGMDGFHLARRELDRLGRSDRKGAFDTFDVDGYLALLRRLRDQRAGVIYGPAFDRGLEEPIGSAVAVAAETPLVITEGNYLLLDHGGWQDVRVCLDQVWFLAVDAERLHHRLVSRRESYGQPRDQAEQWVTDVDAANATVVDATQERADLVVRLADSLG